MNSCQTYTICFLFLVMLVSCSNSELEVAPWNNTPVPVVYSILSPNDPVEVYVNRTYNQYLPAVKNPYPEARVYLCGPDSNWIELTRLSPDTCVFADTRKQLVVEKGKTYSLKVVLNQSTVHAQTTIPVSHGIITEASCTTLISYLTSHAGIHIADSVVAANINSLDVSFTKGTDPDCGYYLYAFSSKSTEYFLATGNRYYSSTYFTPKDIASFKLNLMTVDRYYRRFLEAQDINLLSVGYGSNSPILALTESFGGVLPQFSNIVNGVGLFGNSITDVKQVIIKAQEQ